MTPIENEIAEIKKEVISMWILVQSQLNKAKDAMVQFDKDLAREVLIKEKRVNSFELKIVKISLRFIVRLLLIYVFY
jgi:phosphate transport system protein